MFRHAFRLHRGGMIGYGAASGLTMLATAASWPQIAGATAASRAAFGRVTAALGPQLSFMLTAPHRLDTLAGYVLWKGWGVLPLVVGLWAVLAAAGAARADEQRHVVDAWLAAGVSRARLATARLTAFGAAVGVFALATAAGTLLGGAGVGGPGAAIAPGGLAAQAVAVWLLGWSCFALCYLVAQLPDSPRAAQAAAAAVAGALYVLDAAARTQPRLDGAAWLSPFHWYEATYALVPGGHVSAWGLALSGALVLAAGAAAARVFRRRDVGAGMLPAHPAVVRRPDHPPSRALTWPVARLLHRERAPILLWCAVNAFLGAAMVGLARTVAGLAGLPPVMASVFAHATGGLELGLLALLWTGMAQLVLAGCAAQTVAGWTADDTSGVLAALLGRPTSRAALVLERGAAAALALALVGAAGAVAAGLAAAASGVALSTGRLAAAGALFVPFGLVFAAAGAGVGGRWPRGAAIALGVVAILSFLDADVAAIVGLPAWAGNLSVFRLYGNPLVAGPYWTGLGAMLAIIVAGFGLGAYAMGRRDVA